MIISCAATVRLLSYVEDKYKVFPEDIVVSRVSRVYERRAASISISMMALDD